jgi:hypothetical protein
MSFATVIRGNAGGAPASNALIVGVLHDHRGCLELRMACQITVSQ